MNYGLPYQGSKNRIVKKLATFFPRAEHFFDLFAGGCAMPEDFAEIGHKSTLCATSVKKTKEKLFIPAHQKELYETMLFNSFQCLQSWKEY